VARVGDSLTLRRIRHRPKARHGRSNAVMSGRPTVGSLSRCGILNDTRTLGFNMASELKVGAQLAVLAASKRRAVARARHWHRPRHRVAAFGMDSGATSTPSTPIPTSSRSPTASRRCPPRSTP
jgi:hypothetical protein